MIETILLVACLVASVACYKNVKQMMDKLFS